MKESQEFTRQNFSSSLECVNVFFRNCRKEAKLVPLRSPCPPEELKVLASICFNIHQKRIVLFYNGFRIDNHDLPLLLTERSIIHVIDQRGIDAAQVMVSFRPMWSAHTLKLCLSPDTLVKKLVQEYLVPRYEVLEDRFFLVYVGKVLNKSNELRQQCIEDGAEIILVLHKRPQGLERTAIQRSSSKKIDDGAGSRGVANPVTYLTSLQSLKKKNHQSAGNSHLDNPPYPQPLPEPLEKLQPLNSQNQTLSVGPLQKSAMMLSKNEKQLIESSGAGAQRKYEEKHESSGSSSNRKSNKSAEAEIKIVITGSGSGSGVERVKPSEGKILELQSNLATKQVTQQQKGSLEKLLERMESEHQDQ